MTAEGEPGTKALPIINNETRDKLLEHLGLDMDRKTRQIVENISGEKKPRPDQLRESLGIDVFSSIVYVNREFVQKLQEDIKENLYHGHVESYRSDCVEGMAIVIKAFDIQSNSAVIENFRNLSSADILKIRTIIQEALGGGNAQDILEQALRIPRIPEQQINLNSVIELSARQDLFEGPVRSGAGIMYKIFSEFKDKLLPN